jgi:hypothetical protein
MPAVDRVRTKVSVYTQNFQFHMDRLAKISVFDLMDNFSRLLSIQLGSFHIFSSLKNEFTKSLLRDEE